MNKLIASTSISAVSDPLNINVEFVCKECGNDITPISLNCSQCKSTLISGMDPFINRILSFIILFAIPFIISVIVGLAIGKANGGIVVGVIIGALLATSVKRLFKSEGIWAMMRIGDSIILEFFCPTSTWKKGILPILVYLSQNTQNIFKSQTLNLNNQERSIIKKIFDAKLKPSETGASVNLENKQKNLPVKHPDGSSIINITRLPKTRGSFNIFDVYIDDKKEFELTNGQSFKIDTYPGNHTIRIQVQGWLFWSDTFSFSLASGETIHVSCIFRFNRGPLIERVTEGRRPK